MSDLVYYQLRSSSNADALAMQSGEDVWPELREHTGRRNTLEWSEGLRSEEEQYIATLGKSDRPAEVVASAYTRDPPENKLAHLKRPDQLTSKAASENKPHLDADVAESVASDSDQDDVREVENVDHDDRPNRDDPGLALLWDQPKQEDVRATTDRSQKSPEGETFHRSTTDARRGLLSRVVSSAGRVQFSPRVRVSSGVHASTPPSRRPSQSASFFSSQSGPPSSVSSSISVSLRTSSPRTWLFPNAILGSSDRGDQDETDYFSVPASSRASSRRASMPYNAEDERLAAEAARARAELLAPTPSRAPTTTSLSFLYRTNSILSSHAEEVPQRRVAAVKSEEDVIWGHSGARWFKWRWWWWKFARLWHRFVHWVHGGEGDRWTSYQSEQRTLV